MQVATYRAILLAIMHHKTVSCNQFSLYAICYKKSFLQIHIQLRIQSSGIDSLQLMPCHKKVNLIVFVTPNHHAINIQVSKVEYLILIDKQGKPQKRVKS